MTMPIPRKPLLRGVLLVAVGAILIAVACAVPTPLPLEDETDLPAALPAAVESGSQDVSASISGIMEEPTFTPFTVRPDITNRGEVAAALENEYPPLLRSAGIGGTVHVWFFLDDTGEVRRTIVNRSSGHAALDEAALRVAEVVRFTPARNRDESVPVWISLPVTFSVAEGENTAPGKPERPREGGQAVRVVRSPGSQTPLARVPHGKPEVELPPEQEIGSRSTQELAESPTFTPFTVRPDITNREAIARAVEAEYPPRLRDSGVGGTANVWFFIDETGTVRRVLLNESSGQEPLDEAALRVAGQIEFTPALNRDKPVPVWIALPITFTVR